MQKASFTEYQLEINDKNEFIIPDEIRKLQNKSNVPIYVVNKNEKTLWLQNIDRNINELPCKNSITQDNISQELLNIILHNDKTSETNNEQRLKYILEGSNALLTRNRGIVALPTGTGKTLIIAVIVEQLQNQKILIVAPSLVIIGQIKSLLKKLKIDKNVDVKTPISASKIAPDLDNTQPKYDCIIFDECFVSGTKIGDKNIEDIKIGDYVDSYNHTTNKIEKKKVLSLFKNPAPQKLILTNTKYGSIISTLEHPIFNGIKYDAAKNFRKGNFLFYMCRMCKKNDTTRLFLKSLVEYKTNFFKKAICLLFSQLLCKRNFQKNEVKKSNAIIKNKAKNVRYFKKNWAQTKNSRWKWQGINITTTKIIRSVRRWLVPRINNLYQKCWKGVSKKLQNRYCESDVKNCHRNRWRFAFFFDCTKERFKKNSLLRKVWVEGSKVLERTSNGRYTNGHEYDYVYNIEVEDNNNYFANGILVHNCHKMSCNGYLKSLFRASTQQVYGLSASISKYGTCSAKYHIGSLVYSLPYSTAREMEASINGIKYFHQFEFGLQKTESLQNLKGELFGLEMQLASELTFLKRNHSGYSFEMAAKQIVAQYINRGFLLAEANNERNQFIASILQEISKGGLLNITFLRTKECGRLIAKIMPPQSTLFWCAEGMYICEKEGDLKLKKVDYEYVDANFGKTLNNILATSCLQMGVNLQFTHGTINSILFLSGSTESSLRQSVGRAVRCNPSPLPARAHTLIDNLPLLKTNSTNRIKSLIEYFSLPQNKVFLHKEENYKEEYNAILQTTII